MLIKLGEAMLMKPILGRGAINPHSPHAAPVLPNRATNLLGGTVVFVLIAPLMLLIALLVYAETGSVLVKQENLGVGGRTFYSFSFQTQKPSKAGDATKGRTRQTRSGAVLQSLGMDVLPQIFNVIKGDMLIVGLSPLHTDRRQG